MRHLSADRLAALADEAPTTEEQAHLAACAACSADRDAHRRIVASAALERRREGAVLSDWAGIAAQLRRDGIIRTPDAEQSAGGAVVPLPFASAPRPAIVRDGAVAEPRSRGARFAPRWAMRAAAAVVLVAGGAMAGRMTGGTAVAPNDSVAIRDDSGSVPNRNALMVDNPKAPAEAPAFQNTAQARLALQAAERTYQAAFNYLATHDTALKVNDTDPVDAYQARLAALDEAVAATRRALKVAPNDPVMKSYYLSSVGAREATLRQIDDALPVTERVTRF